MMYPEPKLIFHRSSATNELSFVGEWFRGVKSPQWELAEAIEYTLSTGQIIRIPLGFLTDLSSVPKFLWSLFPPFGDFLLAAIVHDYLYKTRLVSRKQADKEMLLLSNQLNHNKADNYTRYAGVRAFGARAYKKD